MLTLYYWEEYPKPYKEWKHVSRPTLLHNYLKYKLQSLGQSVFPLTDKGGFKKGVCFRRLIMKTRSKF
jgi:hypothetical protein